MWFGKSVEYWATLAAMVLYVVVRDAEKDPLSVRLVKTLASALLTYGLSPSVAPLLNGSELFAVVVVMALGLITLDVLAALISDREFIKSIIRERFRNRG